MGPEAVAGRVDPSGPGVPGKEYWIFAGDRDSTSEKVSGIKA